jgi:hypothetical protein
VSARSTPFPDPYGANGGWGTVPTSGEIVVIAGIVVPNRVVEVEASLFFFAERVRGRLSS